MGVPEPAVGFQVLGTPFSVRFAHWSRPRPGGRGATCSQTRKGKMPPGIRPLPPAPRRQGEEAATKERAGGGSGTCGEAPGSKNPLLSSLRSLVFQVGLVTGESFVGPSLLADSQGEDACTCYFAANSFSFAFSCFCNSPYLAQSPAR